METQKILNREEKLKEKCETLYRLSLLGQLILGIVMAVIGYNYTWDYHKAEYDEDNLCTNGTAWWLWVAGLILVISQLIELSACWLANVMFIVDVAMLFWGTVLVFEAWATWTSDFDAYKANPEELNFCDNIPMMTAFIILLLKWVLVPVIICYSCGFLCWGGCCVAEAASVMSENSEWYSRNRRHSVNFE